MEAAPKSPTKFSSKNIKGLNKTSLHEIPEKVADQDFFKMSEED